MARGFSVNCQSTSSTGLLYGTRGVARRMRTLCLGMPLVIGLVCDVARSSAQSSSVTDKNSDAALETLSSAAATTAGSEEIRQAWQTVSQWPAERLMEVLDAAENANPVALNWLRTAIDGMLEQPGFQMPVAELQEVVQDKARKSAVRRIALELLESSDPKLVDALTEGFINDPMPALRRRAVAKRIELANTMEKKSDERRQFIRELFRSVRDEDQVNALSRVLKDEFDDQPDLAKHFGFIINWNIVGPFPNIDEAGFHQAYPPEQVTVEAFDSEGNLDETIEYETENVKLRWQQQTAVNDTGELDLNQYLGKEKEVVGYGAAVFESPTARPAEIRLRMQNAFKLWLNGELIQSQPIGHTGNSFDMYVVPVQLKAGRNLILMKSCQNKPPQEMEWFDVWHINVRICDETGAAIGEGK